FELIHAGFPRRCVCGSRLSSARTCQPSRTRRSTTCEPIRPAPPVTSARFIGVGAFVSNAFQIQRLAQAPLQQNRSACERLPYNWFLRNQGCKKSAGIRRKGIIPVLAE